MTVFARDARYPAGTVVGEPEHDRAVADARAVVRWAEGGIARPGRLRERWAGRYPSPSPHPGGAPDPELLSQLVERIVAAAAPDRIILFGSDTAGPSGCGIPARAGRRAHDLRSALTGEVPL